MLTLLVSLIVSTQSPVYTSELPSKFLGWYSQNRYVALDSEVGGAGLEMWHRTVVDSASSKTVKQWSRETDSSAKPLEVQSRSWFKSHPASSKGRVVFAYKGPYFDAKKDLSPISSARFTSGHHKYSMKLEHRQQAVTVPASLDLVPRADYTLSVRRDNGPWKVLHRGFGHDVLAYGIDRVITHGTHVAIILAQFNGIYFEGWNLAVERVLVAGKLP